MDKIQVSNIKKKKHKEQTLSNFTQDNSLHLDVWMVNYEAENEQTRVDVKYWNFNFSN